MKARHLQIHDERKLLTAIYSNVHEVSDRRNKKPVVLLCCKFVVYFGFSSFFYFSLYSVTHPVVFTAGFIGYGVMTVLLAFNFAHDFSHGTLFKSEFWNDLGFRFIYTLNGAHAEAWKERHLNSHHHAPNVVGYDSDLRISKIIRILPMTECYWYHRFQHVYAPWVYTLYSLFWICVKDFVVLFSKNEVRECNDVRYHTSFWLQKILYFVYLLIFPILFSRQNVPVVITAFFLMHAFQSLFLLFTFLMTHHVIGTEYPEIDDNGVINSTWLMNQVRSSNDMYPFSHVANFIFGGFNNHTAHHIFPNIHHAYYPELSRNLYKTLIEYGIKPNQTTYWGGICSHLRLLKRMSVK
jgi:linoleoyl-CoA desaturase